MFKIKYLITKYISYILSILRFKKNNNVFLLYHKIYDEDDFTEQIDINCVEKKKFEKQCYFLKSFYQERISDLKSNSNKKGSITITFDDGHKSIINYVFPIIEKYKIPIIIFICPELIGKPNYLSIEDLKILNNSNLVEIGSHGYKHVRYRDFDISRFQIHMKMMNKWFKDKINKDNLAFSFPFGSYNLDILNLIYEKNFFEFCFSSEFRTQNFKNFDKKMIPRIQVWDIDNLNVFKNKIDGHWDWVSKLVSYG